MAMMERQHAANQLEDQAREEVSGAASLTAGYIEEMVTEMEKLAASDGLETLRFLLGRAREEAQRAAAG